MYTSTIASAALMAATVLAQSPGRAIVRNGCKYDVKLSNVPAADGGYDSVDKTLGPDDTYSQTFTELSNGMGWSIKLSKDGNFGSNVLQYEYTYHPGEPIWYDLSEVNGNPWSGNWEITATGGDGCSPRQAAYRFATDDAYGMQDCTADSDITVLLCSGESQNDGIASGLASSASAVIESIVSSSAAPSPSEDSNVDVIQKAQVQETPAVSSSVIATPTATTLITHAAAPAGVVVTEYATVVVTEIATATHYARDEHVHRHAHRHPHARK